MIYSHTYNTIHICILDSQVVKCLDGELFYTKILEVNLFTFAYSLFHEDFSSIDGMQRPVD